VSKDRKIIIIKSRFQHELIIKTVLTTFITLNIILISAYMMTESLFGSSITTQQFMQYIAILELVAAAAIYMISRSVSFHIAGPIYAVERSLKAMQEGDVRAAIIRLKTALQKDPELIPARRVLGQAYLITGAGAGAEKELKRVVESDSTPADVQGLAHALILQRKYQDALDILISKRRNDGKWTVQAKHPGQIHKRQKSQPAEKHSLNSRELLCFHYRHETVEKEQKNGNYDKHVSPSRSLNILSSFVKK